MGYSNNKWRKILIILMIINLCFIIFAKFSKVFATDEPSFTVETEQGTFTFPSWIKLYNYAIFCSKYNNVPMCYFVILDDDVDTCYIHKSSPDSAYYAIDNRPVINYGTGSGGYSCVISEQDAISHYKWEIGNNFGCQIYTDLIDHYLYYYSNFDIKDNSSHDIILPENNFVAPHFDNTSEIENGNPNGVFISAGSLTDTDNLYFHLLEVHTGVSAPDNSVYYYSDKTFLLNKNSGYYSTYQDTNEFYYYIPRYKLGLSQNTSYLYVLNNSSSQIQNSNGIYEKDVANGIYDVLQSDTAGVISATEEQSDIMRNMEQQAIENSNSINNINNTLNDTNVSSSTENEINANLNFNNQNSTLNNLNSGFFSRLTTMISNLIPYNLNEDTTINIPYPNSNKNLILHSNIISSNLSNTLILIINSFWIYIFSFYLFKFINKIYIAVTTGNILDTFNSNDEAITNNML